LTDDENCCGWLDKLADGWRIGFRAGKDKSGHEEKIWSRWPKLSASLGGVGELEQKAGKDKVGH
jgi:hypothetical protein